MQKRKYDKIAEKYGGYNDITEWEFGFNEVVKQLDFKNKVILDYGCGNAKFDRYLLDRGAKRCIGVDNSKEMINIAKKQKTPFLDLYVIKGNKLNFIKSNSIDTAVINWVLCTIQKKKKLSRY